MSISNLSAHGATMPVIGLGTSGMGDIRAETVATALKLGYRHIDTAWKYGTERQVGEGIRASRVPRASRESELAIACCKGTVSYGGTVRPCWPDNSIGGDRFRLRWSNQGKRAEGCGCDLVNPVAANQ